MIVPMLKTYVAGRLADRDRLLEALRDLGVLHLTPMDPAKAVAAEETTAAIDRLGRAAQLLGDRSPAGGKPDLTALDAAEEVLAIQRNAAERRSRLSNLHRQIEQLAVWGDARLDQFQQLHETGVDVRVISAPTDAVGQIDAECVQTVGELAGHRSLVVVIHRDGDPTLPEDAEPVELPQRDRPALRAEAAEIEQANADDAKRIEALAHFTEAMLAERKQLQQRAEFAIASRGGIQQEQLYAVQGWIPAAKADALADGLTAAGVAAGVRTVEPTEDDVPPTLIQYPRWVKPIQGLFDILGTLPAYEELDLSPFFMIALPLFAAMLIGDAGYGLIFLALPALMYKKLIKAAGPAKTHLLMVVGAMTLVWGILTANYFGVTPANFTNPDGTLTGVGGFMATLGVLWHPTPKIAQEIIIKVSFLIGSVHLVLAHLRQALAYCPDRKALAEIGWSLVLVGMLGIIWLLFFGVPPWILWTSIGLLAVGLVLAVYFAFPEQRMGKRIGFGIASSLLPIIGAFGDTMSYIRLMAVGLASYYIASAFNGLGAMLGETMAILWIPGALIIVFGHALNIGLAVIAIFAHGVRLNMLEFSSNAGVQWAGYAYKPFAGQQIKES